MLEDQFKLGHLVPKYYSLEYFGSFVQPMDKVKKFETMEWIVNGLYGIVQY